MAPPDDELIPRAKDVPADAAVYRSVRRRLKRLATIREVVRRPRDLLYYSIGYVEDLSYRYQIENAGKMFRLMGKSRLVMQTEFEKAREWLFGVVKMQEKVFEKADLYRLLRAGVEKEGTSGNDEAASQGPGAAGGEEAESTRDLRKLYMRLTESDREDEAEDDEEWDFEDHLESAFILTLQDNYAEKYAAILQKLRERVGRRPNSSLSPTQRILRRMIEKTQSSKVDNIACAIPLTAIQAMSEEDQSCSICQNAYLDLHTFPIEDLIADYPVRIKYCGHIYGKQCLETWMETPLIDAAKYPFHTCPICRVQIEGRESCEKPKDLARHVHKDVAIKAVIKEADYEIDEYECMEGMLKCISDEIILAELSREVTGLEKGCKLIGTKLKECKTVLEKRKRENDEEKKMWGFEGEEQRKIWSRIGEKWRECGKS
ncbi:hypothetical protein P280DRAFT_464928 [Massarina eburnea CBS 473.64]|uniref:RING-type domain-containing protein n=1 Tax=Massarina eburnea CBS 473.64 TaxID=1395130 RepID=A0A6A6SK28_9PLEO|nr:hypothetical protein P280DRAFT_464928 [Massarina eburnea CBS 473.64]